MALIYISFCLFYVGFTVLYLLCAEAKLITGTSTVADTAAGTHSTKDGPLSEIYADLCLKHGCPTGKLTCDNAHGRLFLKKKKKLLLLLLVFFLHDILSTELTPGVAFYADITSRTTFARGSKGKTLLVNFVSTAKLIKSGIWRGGVSIGRDFLFKDA